MGISRILRHLFASRLGTLRRFPASTLQAIEDAIASTERHTSGEIRFAVETALDIPELWVGKTPRQRALEAFAQLRVWDSELRNGVLIYVLVADHDVEIVADRAAAARIPGADWETACRLMEQHFRARDFKGGAVAGVTAVGALLEKHFPPRAGDRDEQPNRPHLL
jgi:uncharacterized membrane protein